jgi:peptide/nickel transport system ATP-binding protein
MSQPLLSVQNLCIDFNTVDKGVTAVKNISFTVAAGEMVAIVGESGSGKSVTALSVLKLLPSKTSVKGKLVFLSKGKDSLDLLEATDKVMTSIRGKDIAMIFQEPMSSLNPLLTCGYQMIEAIQLHEQISSVAAKKRAIDLFKKVNLPFPEIIINRYPHQLSGGQKQRVMIAMAISCNPSLLIADEPTTALDVTVQKTILQLIKELQLQMGLGVIFITHDLSMVSEIADSVIVMYQGEIVEQGIASEVLQNPKHPYTKALMACRPSLHPKGERLPVVSDFLVPQNKSNEKPILLDTQSIGLFNSTPAEIVLQVENLTMHFFEKKSWFKKSVPTIKALDGINLTIKKGEIVGLVGESGCGKTTLVKAILQLIKPSSGKIILNGMNLPDLSKMAMRSIRKDLQIVFQDPYGSLNPRLTIGAAIEEPLKVHGIFKNQEQRKNRVLELLDKVKLQPEHFNRYPHEFSGGQRQRICIARALALNPSFLIFDESVSALDVSVQAQVLNLLNDLRLEFGFTAIFISHDLSVVRYISDRILVMEKGKIIEAGNSDDIWFSPQNEYTKKLISAIPGNLAIGKPSIE